MPRNRFHGFPFEEWRLTWPFTRRRDGAKRRSLRSGATACCALSCGSIQPKADLAANIARQ